MTTATTTANDREKLRTLGEVASAAPIPVHRTTLDRWGRNGVAARDGRRLKLFVLKIGGRTFTSLAAVDRLIAALTGPTNTEESKCTSA